jgi:hypothetical protein
MIIKLKNHSIIDSIQQQQQQLNNIKKATKNNSMIIKFDKFYHLLLISIFLHSISIGSACDIWRAADCVGGVTKGEEEKMKDGDYTTKELYKYCDKGKAYVDCINDKLKCCDLKPEMRGSLAAYNKLLEKQAWKLGPYCSGLGAANIIQYRCRTTPGPATTTTFKLTKPTLAPCNIEQVI